MREEDVIADLKQIDGLLARCVNPPLTRAEHDGIRQTMGVIAQRVKLSYELERDKKDAEANKKEAEVEKGETLT